MTCDMPYLKHIVEVAWSLAQANVQNAQIDIYAIVDTNKCSCIQLDDALNAMLIPNVVFHSMLYDNIVDSKVVKNIKGHSYSRAVYAKTFMLDTLPTSINKFIYLDADVVVCDSRIFHYLDVDIQQPIAACLDLTVNKYEKGEMQAAKTNLYFNSGVMVVDRSNIHLHRIVSRLLDYLRNSIITAKYADQSILNIFFAEQWLPIDLNFNFLVKDFAYYDLLCSFKNLGYCSKKQLIDFVSIAHYAGRLNYWNNLNSLPQTYMQNPIILEFLKKQIDNNKHLLQHLESINYFQCQENAAIFNS